jgi:predicted permease
MTGLLQDARYAIRLLSRNPLFALTATLSLAIGIGANTTIFTIANALLFRAPAGVVDADRVVDIGRSENGDGFDNGSYPNFTDLRARSRVFTDVYATQWGIEPMSLGNAAGAERIFGVLVSNNYFETLGTRPAAGRLFSRNDPDAAGATPHVVLTHRFWTRRFQQDPSIVGRELRINGHAFTVAGVAQEGFQGTTPLLPDVFVPINMVAEATPDLSANMLTSRDSSWILMGGRLKPGVSIESAQAEVNAIAATLAREFPQENRGKGFRVAPLSPIPGNSAPVAAFMAGLMVVVALVLAIACANLAGVLLARATSRRREVAVRLALGAGRRRLVRQMFVETAILFLAGAAAGLFVARIMTTLLLAMLPALPVQIDLALALDCTAVLFTAGLSLVAALLSGLAPAFHASRGDVVTSLKADAASAPERMRLRNAFVVAQVALSVVLVVGAGLLVRAMQRAADIDAGFDPRGVEVTTIDLGLAGYTDETGPVFARQILDRVRAIPGVTSATLAARLPLSGGGLGLGRLTLPGAGADDEGIRTDWNAIEPRYFATMRMPLQIGRDFNTDDRPQTPFVAIVNETFAKRMWPNQNAIGKTLVQGGGRDSTRNLTVVGIARDSKYRTLGEAPRNFIYVPLQQQYLSGFTIVARSAQGQRLATDIRTLLASMNSNVPVISSQPLEEYTSIGLLPQRIAASVSASLGIVGLLLAAIGIYGVTAYLVASRTREIGIRMALGADRGAVIRMVLRQGMGLVGLGLLAGFALAIVGAQLLRSLLLGIGTMDPIAFGGTAVMFCVIGLAACYVPVRRATAIDAAVALRAE